MDKKEWKEKVLHCVYSHNGATFANIEIELGKDAKGNTDIRHPSHGNVLLWSGLDAGLAEAIVELLGETRMAYKPIPALIYVMDGAVLPLPTATEARDYKDPHWMPVVLYLCRPHEE